MFNANGGDITKMWIANADESSWALSILSEDKRIKFPISPMMLELMLNEAIKNRKSIPRIVSALLLIRENSTINIGGHSRKHLNAKFCVMDGCLTYALRYYGIIEPSRDNEDSIDIINNVISESINSLWKRIFFFLNDFHWDEYWEKSFSELNRELSICVRGNWEAPMPRHSLKNEIVQYPCSTTIPETVQYCRNECVLVSYGPAIDIEGQVMHPAREYNELSFNPIQNVIDIRILAPDASLSRARRHS